MPIEWISGHKNIFRKEASLNQRFLLFYTCIIRAVYNVLRVIYDMHVPVLYVFYTVHVYNVRVLHTYAYIKESEYLIQICFPSEIFLYGLRYIFHILEWQHYLVIMKWDTIKTIDEKKKVVY